MKDARDVLRQKEADRARIQNEIEALELVIPLLTDDQRQVERKTESFSNTVFSQAASAVQ